MEWQDIETAPKDGTLILLYLPDEREGTRHTVGGWVGDTAQWYGVSPSATGAIWRTQPTHWMKLPPAPALSTE